MEALADQPRRWRHPVPPARRPLCRRCPAPTSSNGLSRGEGELILSWTSSRRSPWLTPRRTSQVEPLLVYSRTSHLTNSRPAARNSHSATCRAAPHKTVLPDRTNRPTRLPSGCFLAITLRVVSRGDHLPSRRSSSAGSRGHSPGAAAFPTWFATGAVTYPMRGCPRDITESLPYDGQCARLSAEETSTACSCWSWAYTAPQSAPTPLKPWSQRADTYPPVGPQRQLEDGPSVCGDGARWSPVTGTAIAEWAHRAPKQLAQMQPP